MSTTAAVPPASKLCSTIIRKYIQKTLKQGVYFNGLPFKWNVLKSRMEMQPSKWRLLHWIVNLMVGLGQFIFVFVRCVQTHSRPDVTMGEMVFMKFQATYFAISLIIHAGVILNFNSIPRVFNMTLDFADHTEFAYVKKGSRRPFITKIVERMLQTLYYPLSFAHVLMISAAVVLPELPHLLSSFMTNPQEISVTRFLCIAHVAYVEYVYHCSVAIIAFPLFPVLAPIIIILDELSVKKSFLTIRKLRNMADTLKMYKCLTVLMTCFNDAYARFVIPAAKSGIITIVAFCTYGAIRLDGVPAMSLGVIGIIASWIILTLFVLLAEVHRRSSAVLRERRQVVVGDGWEQKVLMRELKALRAVKAVLGSGIYFVDRQLLLVMVDTMVKEATGFLLVNN